MCPTLRRAAAVASRAAAVAAGPTTGGVRARVHKRRKPLTRTRLTAYQVGTQRRRPPRRMAGHIRVAFGIIQGPVLHLLPAPTYMSGRPFCTCTLLR